MIHLRYILKGFVVISVVVCIAVILSCRGEEAMNVNQAQRVVRKAVGGGRWFPSNPAKLKAMIAEFVDQAPVSPVTGRVVAAMSPHAGYECSGRVAGYVFRVLRDQAQQGDAPETVVILGLSHQAGFPGVALMDGDAISTPLGETSLDQEAAALMAATSARIRLDYKPHYGEHSAENQVPFVQAVLPNARLVIGLIGDHDPQTIKDMASALNALAQKKKIAVLASSDMLHDPDYKLVTQTDRQSLKILAAMQSGKILEDWSYRHQTFCGVAAVVVAMNFARAQGCQEGTVLYYRNSGDYFPESRGQWVVGYGAVVFAAPGQ